MQVLCDRVLFEEDLENKTKSGLVIASSIDYNTPREATLLEVGSEVKYVKKGDRIMYMPRGGVTFKKDNTNYRILKEEDILAIV